MKRHELNKLLVGSSLALTLAAAVWLPVETQAADQIKGGQKLNELNQINTKEEAEALKPGDAIAMVCAKCKSVAITYVVKENKGHVTRMLPGEKHLCMGCKSTIEVVGVQKGAHTEIKHICKACGDDSAFCCATKPGSAPTKGMGKN